MQRGCERSSQRRRAGRSSRKAAPTAWCAPPPAPARPRAGPARRWAQADRFDAAGKAGGGHHARDGAAAASRSGRVCGRHLVLPGARPRAGQGPPPPRQPTARLPAGAPAPPASRRSEGRSGAECPAHKERRPPKTPRPSRPTTAAPGLMPFSPRARPARERNPPPRRRRAYSSRGFRSGPRAAARRPAPCLGAARRFAERPARNARPARPAFRQACLPAWRFFGAGHRRSPAPRRMTPWCCSLEVLFLLCSYGFQSFAAESSRRAKNLFP